MRPGIAGVTVDRMSETSPTTPSERPYDPAQDPDADPDQVETGRERQPDQPEGEDDPTETGSS